VVVEAEAEELTGPEVRPHLLIATKVRGYVELSIDNAFFSKISFL